MIVIFIMDLLVLLLVIYYITVAIHLIGLEILGNRSLKVGKALLPFYYWIKRR